MLYCRQLVVVRAEKQSSRRAELTGWSREADPTLYPMAQASVTQIPSDSQRSFVERWKQLARDRPNAAPSWGSVSLFRITGY